MEHQDDIPNSFSQSRCPHMSQCICPARSGVIYYSPGLAGCRVWLRASSHSSDQNGELSESGRNSGNIILKSWFNQGEEVVAHISFHPLIKCGWVLRSFWELSVLKPPFEEHIELCRAHSSQFSSFSRQNVRACVRRREQQQEPGFWDKWAWLRPQSRY